MKLPEEVYALAIKISLVEGQKMTSIIRTFVEGRERKAFDRARKATLEMVGEEHEGHLVKGLKFVHSDFDHYQNSEEYEE